MTPGQLVQEKLELSAWYQKATDRLIEIGKEHAVRWSMLRVESKTDKEADNKWASSELGLEEMTLKLKMKACDKRVSAISSALRHLENEARNLM